MFKRLIKNESGFTLIEALVSIVIVGIIVTPLTMIFSGTLNKSLEAKDMLRANELAQLYVENIKQRSYNDFMDIYSGVTGSSITLTGSAFSADYYAGFPTATYTDDYKVTIAYDETTYQQYALTGAAVQYNDFDLIIDINSDGTNSNIEVNYGDGTLLNSFTYNSGSPEMDITVDTNYILTANNISRSGPISFDAIRINCNADNTDIPEYTFNITNEMSDEVAIYVFRENNSKVEVEIDPVEGKVERHYNLNNNTSDADYGVFCIEVMINDAVTNEELAHVYATKIYE